MDKKNDPSAPHAGEEVGMLNRNRMAPCELCGQTTELRPYGPNGEWICHSCGMKDQETTWTMMGKVLFGYSEDVARERAREALELMKRLRGT